MINEDADGAAIVQETILHQESAPRECARMIGKIGPQFTATELADPEEAVGRMTNAIDLRKRMNNADLT